MLKLSARIDIDWACNLKRNRRKHAPPYKRTQNKTKKVQWRLLICILLKMLFIQFLLKLNFVTYLFSVLSSRGIQTLNEIGSMTKEHSITSCTTDHRQHCQPHVCQALRRETTITNAKHVGHRFEHGPWVLLKPIRFLLLKKIKD